MSERDSKCIATCGERAASTPAGTRQRRPATVRGTPTEATSPFQIGPVPIGPGYAVYIVAEAGVNHDGDVALARDLVQAAAEAGANAVKFQVFSADRLVTRSAPAAAYQKQAVQVGTQYEMLSRLELAHAQFTELAAWAEECNIDFLATPFSIPDLEFLISIDVSAIKLASPDVVNGPLLDAAASTGLPVILSTGAAEFDEIASAVERFCRIDAGPLALLHCISSYPASEAEANLSAIRTLDRCFDCVVGFSDHTSSLTTGGYAAAAGASIIEKHLTLDRSRSGPDHGFSLEPRQMAEYIRNIRSAETMLGEGQLEVTPSQRDVRQIARSSIVAAREIRAGQRITRAMLTTKRPGGGISPMLFDSLLGKTAIADIPGNTQITWAQLS